jgi:hypothetical protein
MTHNPWKNNYHKDKIVSSWILLKTTINTIKIFKRILILETEVSDTVRCKELKMLLAQFTPVGKVLNQIVSIQVNSSPINNYFWSPLQFFKESIKAHQRRPCRKICPTRALTKVQDYPRPKITINRFLEVPIQPCSTIRLYMML